MGVFIMSVDMPYPFGNKIPRLPNFFEDRTSSEGRVNGNGVIIDSEYSLNDALSTYYTKSNDSISEMKRYATDKLDKYTVAFPDNIKELMVDGMSDFACSVCVNNTDYDTMNDIISSRLKSSVPIDVYESLKDSILMPKVTYEGSFQNCTKPLQNTGRASNFYGWWNVKYFDQIDQYSACVIVSGVEIAMTDIIVDYNIKKETLKVGDEPCHCGYFRCEKCPIFKTIETKTPVFKKNAITINQHDHLRDYMMYKSMELIRDLKYEPPMALSDMGTNDLKID